MGCLRLLAASVAISALWSSPGFAQDAQIDLRGFHPPTDPDASLALQAPATPDAGDYNQGIWLSYAHELLVVEDTSGENIAIPIKHQVSLDYTANIGITDRMAWGLSIPTVVYQTGDNEQLVDPDGLPTAGIGNLLLDFKGNLIAPGELGGFGLGAIARVSVPTGSKGLFVSDTELTTDMLALTELSMIAIKARAQVGLRVRDTEQFLGERFRDEIPWGAGLLFKPQLLGIDELGRWDFHAELHGSVSLSPDFADMTKSPMLAGLGARYSVDATSVLAGVEVPMNDGLGAPGFRGVLHVGYAPRIRDMDGDGIEDDKDTCLQLAEDYDQFEDSDGCPDYDNDWDGVEDQVDRCPDALEDPDGFEDEDGCPDDDNDKDGIPDTSDACPMQAGEPSSNEKYNGCPKTDTDGDKIFDDVDRCVNEPEDIDQFEDQDGCPDPDNDKDGVPDAADACPIEAGDERSDPELNGCPNPDRDGDTYPDSQDRCPDKPEDFNGQDDEDGCPDAADHPNKKPFAEWTTDDAGARIITRQRLAFEEKDGAVELSADSLVLARAIAVELNRHPEAIVLVGVRPTRATNEAEQQALNRAFSLVLALRSLTYRENVAEVVSWAAVKAAKGASAQGFGLVVLTSSDQR